MARRCTSRRTGSESGPMVLLSLLSLSLLLTSQLWVKFVPLAILWISLRVHKTRLIIRINRGGWDRRTSETNQRCLYLQLSTATFTTVLMSTPPQPRPTSLSLLSLRTMNSLSRLIYRLLTIAHGALGLKYRTWLFSTLFMLGGIGETIGYIGRVGSAYDVTLNVYFIMQVTCLIISPALFSAGLYVTIGNL